MQINLQNHSKVKNDPSKDDMINFFLQQWQCVLLSAAGLNGMYPATTIIYRDDTKFDRTEYWATGYRPFVKNRMCLVNPVDDNHQAQSEVCLWQLVCTRLRW